MRSEVETYGVTSSVARLRRVLVRTPATSGDFEGAGGASPTRRRCCASTPRSASC